MSATTTDDLILLVPDKPDVERDALCTEWKRRGGRVIRLAKFWRPPEIDANSIRIYGPDTFGLVLADIYKLHLIEPPQNVVIDIPEKFLQRDLKIGSLENAFGWRYPTFVKPLVPKAFSARVYPSAEELRRETKGMALSESVLASEIVDIVAEARAFILDAKVLDCALYEGSAELQSAIDCARELARLDVFPRTFVLDLAKLSSGHWVFLEANASWGAGLNGCSAAKVWPAIEAATNSVSVE